MAILPALASEANFLAEKRISSAISSAPDLRAMQFVPAWNIIVSAFALSNMMLVKSSGFPPDKDRQATRQPVFSLTIAGLKAFRLESPTIKTSTLLLTGAIFLGFDSSDFWSALDSSFLVKPSLSSTFLKRSLALTLSKISNVSLIELVSGLKGLIISRSSSKIKTSGFVPIMAVKEKGRCISQNNVGCLAIDCKYWNDPSDQYHREGTMCPLWKFRCNYSLEKNAITSDLCVTSVCWNPKYEDLFAVSLGRREFGTHSTGQVTCFSFKDNKLPEVNFATSSSVLCATFHPRRPNLLAYTQYNGTVGVYDMSDRTAGCRYESCVIEEGNQVGQEKSNEGHIGPVWTVAWCVDHYASGDSELGPQLLTGGSDGKILLWSLRPGLKVCLRASNILTLKSPLYRSVEKFSDKAQSIIITARIDPVCCITFHPINQTQYFVGTEEGRIHYSNVRYQINKPERSFEGHRLNCHQIAFNPFDSKYMLTCGGDWTIKVWEVHSASVGPYMVLPFNSPVLDISWAPYSSTAFVAVLDERKVVFYDLSNNRSKPFHEQIVVGKRCRTTSVRFSQFDPQILVGDSKGNAIVLKLSPNLRKQWPHENYARKPLGIGSLRMNQRSPQDKLKVELQMLYKVLSYEQTHEHVLYNKQFPPPPSRLDLIKEAEEHAMNAPRK